MESSFKIKLLTGNALFHGKAAKKILISRLYNAIIILAILSNFLRPKKIGIPEFLPDWQQPPPPPPILRKKKTPTRTRKRTYVQFVTRTLPLCVIYISVQFGAQHFPAFWWNTHVQNSISNSESHRRLGGTKKGKTVTKIAILQRHPIQYHLYDLL